MCPFLRFASQGKWQRAESILLFALGSLLFHALFPAANGISQTRAETRAVAITFDDLPATAAGVVANDVASLTAMTGRLLNAVRAHGVPAVGFVNEGKLFHPGVAAGDADGRIGVLRMWLDAGLELGNQFAFFETVSRRLLGREIPQVLILHANTLNADRFDAVAAAIARRGYRFISLEEALQDEAYRLPDTFVGAPSNSWFNHWEITAGRAPVPTPRPAEWVGRAAAR